LPRNIVAKNEQSSSFVHATPSGKREKKFYSTDTRTVEQLAILDIKVVEEVRAPGVE